MSNSIAQLINERRKRKGFLGKAWDLAKAGALGYLGYKALKNRTAIGDTLRGLKGKYVTPHQIKGAEAAAYDADLEAKGIQGDIDKQIGDADTPQARAAVGDREQNPNLVARDEAYKKKWDAQGRAKDLKDKQASLNRPVNRESTDIKNFINELGQKNYSGADKYLKKVVEDKLQTKIAKQIKTQKLY